MKLAQAKDIFFKILITSLIAASSVAVVTVLVGEFNEALRNALFTIALMVTHAAISLGFVANNEDQETFDNLAVFTNATFGVIVASFITSILGTWDVISGDFVMNLYMLYFVILFAVLHGEILAKTLGVEKSKDMLVWANYVFMTGVVILLVPVIFAEDAGALSSVYYRVLAAFSIVDATLTLLIVIFHKIYLDKHPKVQDPIFSIPSPAVQGQPGVQQQLSARPAKRMSMVNVFVIVLICYVSFQFVLGILIAIMGGILGGF